MLLMGIFVISTYYLNKTTPLIEVKQPMSILADHQIRKLSAVEQGCKALITPYHTESISTLPEGQKVTSLGESSYGYDISLHGAIRRMITAKEAVELYGEDHGIVVDPCDFDARLFHPVEVHQTGRRIILAPGEFILGVTNEHFALGRDVTGIALEKSTMARSNITVTITPLEAGWSGFLTLEIRNNNQFPAVLTVGMGICQVLWFKGDEPCEVSYDDRSGKYQNQPQEPIIPRAKEKVAQLSMTPSVKAPTSTPVLKGFKEGSPYKDFHREVYGDPDTIRMMVGGGSYQEWLTTQFRKDMLWSAPDPEVLCKKLGWDKEKFEKVVQDAIRVAAEPVPIREGGALAQPYTDVDRLRAAVDVWRTPVVVGMDFRTTEAMVTSDHQGNVLIGREVDKEPSLVQKKHPMVEVVEMGVWEGVDPSQYMEQFEELLYDISHDVDAVLKHTSFDAATQFRTRDEVLERVTGLVFYGSYSPDLTVLSRYKAMRLEDSNYFKCLTCAVEWFAFKSQGIDDLLTMQRALRRDYSERLKMEQAVQPVDEVQQTIYVPYQIVNVGLLHDLRQYAMTTFKQHAQNLHRTMQARAKVQPTREDTSHVEELLKGFDVTPEARQAMLLIARGLKIFSKKDLKGYISGYNVMNFFEQFHQVVPRHYQAWFMEALVATSKDKDDPKLYATGKEVLNITVDDLFSVIKHGDQKHQNWLLEALQAVALGKPVPEAY